MYLDTLLPYILDMYLYTFVRVFLPNIVQYLVTTTNFRIRPHASDRISYTLCPRLFSQCSAGDHLFGESVLGGRPKNTVYNIIY